MTEKKFSSLSEEWDSCPWIQLTKLDEKKEYYRYEPFFREAWGDVDSILGESAVDMLHRHAAICFLPDAIAGRRVESALKFLNKEGFEVIGLHFIDYDWQSYNAEWRFQLNDTTLDRLVLSHDLCSASSSILVLLRDTSFDGKIPATVRLRGLKGASNPKLRIGDNLRDRLNSTNRLLKFIHTPDEPIDFVRMLGVIMEREERIAVLRDLAKADSNSNKLSKSDISEKLSLIYENVAPDPLDPSQSIRYLMQVLRTYNSVTISQARASESTILMLDSALQGTPLNFLKFRELLLQTGVATERWEVVCAATDLIEHKYGDQESMIACDGSELW